ncbi:MAG TPA: M20/M25/M40 family metallo-hydrolase [Candidatus Acidoferrales bacterium]|jgi:putative aminopeptidase FrvX|nr:M20/M25/M40 family metallo-hydrolase [Candidatus Acidoferrales bacterium]
MRLRHFARVVVLGGFAAALCAGAPAQDLRQDLAKFVEIPAVPGYEQALAKEISARLAKWKPQTDAMGNVTVTIGSGAPHRLIATPMDEPGYIVSGITTDGFLRVQRLPQTAPFGYFDALYAAQPVRIQTRSGKMIAGVVAGLSTHLQTGRLNPPCADNLDDIYVDIGATSAAEVRAAGVDVLDPITLDKRLYEMGYGRMTAPAIGDHFGSAALVEMLRAIDPAKVHGTLSVAFLGQEWAGARGMNRILHNYATSQKVDEFIYVGRLIARRPPASAAAACGPVAPAPATGGRGQDAQAAPAGGRGGRGGAPIEPSQPDGAGVLIGGNGQAAALSDFASSLKALAAQNGIPAAADGTAPIARGTDAAATPLPEKFAHLSIATLWPSTPAEEIDADDLVALTRLLEVYAQGSATMAPIQHATAPLPRPALPPQPKVAPTPTELVSKLTEAYGVSRHEADVRALVLRMLPPWVKPQTDETGDVWVHVGDGAKNSKTPKIAVVAHMDEIGFEVVGIDPDGRLVVASRGGGIMDFFAAHVVLVHTANGDIPGVIQLPEGWTRSGFSLRGGGGGGGGAPAGAAGGTGGAAGGAGGANPGEPSADAGAGAQAGRGGGGGGGSWRVDVGARNPAEVAQLGIKASATAGQGDFVTIPKKYRPLLGRRANARSFDDRVGCAASISAIWALGPQLPGRDVTFIFSWGEEIGLFGAAASAKEMADAGRAPDYVFAIDTFVSSDSPLESKRFADAVIGNGFVVRAVDNSNITPRDLADKVVRICKLNNIPVQYGITGGGNDGSTFLPYGTLDVGMGWPLRYSHSPGEVIDTRDLDALAHVLAAVAKSW